MEAKWKPKKTQFLLHCVLEKQNGKLFPNLRASSTIKPFDLASWVRKLLLLRPIFLSTRYSLTSSNFTSSRPGPAGSSGLDLFLTRGARVLWDISFVGELSLQDFEPFWFAVCHLSTRFGNATAVYFTAVAFPGSVSVRACWLELGDRMRLWQQVLRIWCLPKTTCQDRVIEDGRQHKCCMILLAHARRK